MKIIIAGGRDFNDIDAVRAAFYQKEIGLEGDWTVLSGGARGADRLGELVAHEHGLRVDIHPADWEGLGKRAGFARNLVMANEADELIAFWDLESKGTRHMIECMKRLGKPVTIEVY